MTLGLSNSKWPLKPLTVGATETQGQWGSGQRSRYKGAEVLGTEPFSRRLTVALPRQKPQRDHLESMSLPSSLQKTCTPAFEKRKIKWKYFTVGNRTCQLSHQNASL